MKAVRIHEYGGIDKLHVEEAPDPVAGPGEVLIGLHAAALNHLDMWVRMGTYGDRIKLPHILGSDGAGEVLSVGAGVTDLKPGDGVAISPGLSCGRCEACLSGKDNICRDYVILGVVPEGTYAEKVVVPRANILRKPENISYAEAASLPLVLVTAWHMLVGLAEMELGETVLVLGGSSGVGSVAIQIAKLYQANVIATASTPKLEMVKKLGADHVIDHSKEDVLARVRELTGKKGVDIVFEHIGEATWDTSIKSLRPGGRLVTCGGTSGTSVVTDLRYVYSRNLKIFGDYMGTKGELLKAWRLVEEGKIRAVVDRVFSLEEAAQAHGHVEARHSAGKVVLKIG